MLVDLETTKKHLRRDDDDDDDRIVKLIRASSDIVLDFLKISEDSYSGTDGNLVDVPLMVEQATLLVIENLYDRPTEDPLTEAVRSILHRMRDPALA
jgi:hypothetical protein